MELSCTRVDYFLVVRSFHISNEKNGPLDAVNRENVSEKISIDHAARNEKEKVKRKDSKKLMVDSRTRPYERVQADHA